MNNRNHEFSGGVRGRFESWLDDPRWQVRHDGSRTLGVFLGEEDDGPAVFGYEVPAGAPAPAHFHRCHYLNLILRGSLQVGRKWYHAGEIRMQEAGAVYGPELAGPSGCTMLNVFSDRRGAAPSLPGEPEHDTSIAPDVLLTAIWNDMAQRPRSDSTSA